RGDAREAGAGAAAGAGGDARDRVPRKRRGAASGACAFAGSPGRSGSGCLARERIGPQLQLDRLRPVLLAAFEVEVGPRPGRSPERTPFPSRALVVDAPVDVLRELARRPRQAQREELAVDEG